TTAAAAAVGFAIERRGVADDNCRRERQLDDHGDGASPRRDSRHGGDRRVVCDGHGEHPHAAGGSDQRQRRRDRDTQLLDAGDQDSFGHGGRSGDHPNRDRDGDGSTAAAAAAAATTTAATAAAAAAATTAAAAAATTAAAA